MKKLLVSLLVLAVGVTAGTLALTQNSEAEGVRDKDGNAVCYGGALNVTELKNCTKKHADIPALYSRYDITSTMVNKVKPEMGVVTKGGDVIVDGKVVATGARSVGRHNMPGSTPFKAGGTTFYERSTSVSFRSGSIPAFVWFDEYGKYVASVITSCGNPVKAHPKPKPFYQCSALKVTPKDKRNHFTFNVDATIRDATFDHVTYVVRDSKGNAIQHIRADHRGDVDYVKNTNPGDYTVEAVVTVKVNGKLYDAKVGDCKKPFTVKPQPLYRCEELKVDSISRTSFKFNLKTTAKDGATFKSATYIIKDANNKIVDTTSNTTYSQETPGDYTVATKLIFTVDGKDVTVEDPKCVAKFTVAPAPAYECKKLDVSPISRTSFKFTTTVKAENGAKFKNVTYTVKKGNTVVKTFTEDTLTATYDQTEAGDYTVTAVAKFTAEGKEVVGQGNCVDTFTVQPVVYECKSLKVTRNTRTSFTFTPTLNLKNVTLKSVVYTVKSGNSTVSTINRTNANPVDYPQTTPGTYKVNAVATVTVDGKDVVAPGVCEDEFTVDVAPAFECTAFGASPITGQRNAYRFALSYRTTGAAVLSGVKVNFGDNTPVQNVPLNTLSNIPHTYVAPGTYRATATLSFVVEGNQNDVKNVDCSTTVTITPEMCTVPGKEHLPKDHPDCKPPVEMCEVPGKTHLPKGHPDCKPPVEKCEIPGKEHLPKDSPLCKEDEEAPVELPKTGIGGVVGAFTGISTAAAALHFAINRRRVS